MTEKTFDKSKHFRMHPAISDNYAPIIRAQGIAIYAVISRFCGWDNLPASVSYKKMAHLAGVSERTAKRVVKKLQELQLISKTNGTGKDGGTLDNVYQLLLPPPALA